MKHYLLLLAALLLMMPSAYGQTKRPSKPSSVTVVPYVAATVKPQFPGGVSARNSYLRENLIYPAAAVGSGVYGKVKLAFVVEADGCLSGIRVLEGLKNTAINNAAKKVVAGMPSWIPGEKNGRRVRVSCTIVLNYSQSMPVQKVDKNEEPDMEFSNDQPIETKKSADNKASAENTASTGNDDKPVNAALVEQKPTFPGGDAAMYKFISENITYPAAAAEDDVTGKVIVQFIIEKDGSITGVHVVRGKHPALDAEAKRVVSLMPKWNPGKNNGQPVRVMYYLPVNFKLKADVTSENNKKETEDVKVVEEKKAGNNSDNTVFEAVEQGPQFPGGDAAMFKWIGEHINYPASAAEEGVQGRVIVKFIIEKDGSVTDVRVARGKHPALDAEAVRVVKTMPKWNPGKNNGMPVRVSYNLPITFRM